MLTQQTTRENRKIAKVQVKNFDFEPSFLIWTLKPLCLHPHFNHAHGSHEIPRSLVSRYPLLTMTKKIGDKKARRNGVPSNRKQNFHIIRGSR